MGDIWVRGGRKFGLAAPVEAKLQGRGIDSLVPRHRGGLVAVCAVVGPDLDGGGYVVGFTSGPRPDSTTQRLRRGIRRWIPERREP